MTINNLHIPPINLLLHNTHLRIPIYPPQPGRPRPQALLTLIIILQPPDRRPPRHQLGLITRAIPPLRRRKDLRTHLIPRARNESQMRVLGSQARLVVLRARLRMRGRDAADAWLERAESVALGARVRV
jgi:hypothetical protein